MLAQGKVVEEFEQKFAELTGAKYGVAVTSGTTALVAAVQALNLKPGDEVVTSPFTFVATLNAILEAGATAVFADISDDDFNIDPDLIEQAITPKTKVLMPVHLYGQAARMDRIMAIAQAHRLQVIEDAAQAHGAEFNGQKVGSFGVGCFSFYGTKNLTTGEGGMVTTSDAGLADTLRVMRNQGMKARYQYEMAGHNYRMTNVQAAMGIPQIATYTQQVQARQANAQRLIEGLAGIPGLVTPKQMPGRSHVWHQFTVRVTKDAKLGRDEFVDGLRDKGVGSGIYYPRVVFDYPTYLNHPRVRASVVPVASRVATEVVSLPVHPGVSSEDLDQIIAAVRELLA
jgi:dTDP-4-amino-4,6-dideoxygalactose transaminase